MNLEDMKFFLKSFVGTVKPWKVHTGSEEYNAGWNDCIKEMNKRIAEFNKQLQLLAADRKRALRRYEIQNEEA